MREIKFRYRWQNYKTKEIITSILTLNQIENQGLSPNPFQGFEWNELSRDQFTGRLDIDRQEIYEGDVINAIIAISPSVKTMGEIAWNDYLSAWCNKNLAGMTPLYNLSSIKIIGNVYENPELVKE